MTESSTAQTPQQLAERVRALCLQTLMDAYQQARDDGMCADGAWEVALDQVRALQLADLLADEPPTR